MRFHHAYLIALAVMATGAVHAADSAPTVAPAGQAGSNANISVGGATQSAGTVQTAAEDSGATTNRSRSDDRYYATDPNEEGEVGGNRTGAVDNDLDTDRDSDNERDSDLNRTGAADNDHSTERTHGRGDTSRD